MSQPFPVGLNTSSNYSPQAADSASAGKVDSRLSLDRVFGTALLLLCTYLLVTLKFTLNFNTPYADESDYMFVGQLLLDGAVWPSKAYIFSSNLPLYLIGWGSGYADQLGARALSLVPGTLALLALFALYRSILTNNWLAITATAIVAMQASHIFQSKFATYDIWCLFFFSVSVAMIYRHTLNTRAVSIALIGGSCMLATAVLCKYVAGAYIPVIFALLWITGKRGSAIIFFFIQSIALGIYAIQNLQDLITLFNTQLAGQHVNNSSIIELLKLMLFLSWPVLLLTAGGVLYVTSSRTPFQNRSRLRRRMLFSLLALSLVLPAYHLLSGNRIAVYKHLIYSVIFLAPIAALGISYLSKNFNEKFHLTLHGSLALILLLVAQQHTAIMETAYPNTNKAMQVLASEVDHNSTILSENPYLHRFHFIDKVPLQNMHDMDSLPLADVTDFEAPIMEAIAKGQYHLVVLDGRFHPEKTEFLRTTLGVEYEEIYSSDYDTSDVVSGNTRGKITIHKLLE